MGHAGDLTVIKYDANGNELWTRDFANMNYAGSHMVVDSQGSAVVIGREHLFLLELVVLKIDTSGNVLWINHYPWIWTGGRLELAPNDDIYLLNSSINDTVMKLSPAGDTLWSVGLGLGFTNASIDLAPNGNLALTGHRNGSVFTASYDPLGTELWSRTWGGGGGGWVGTSPFNEVVVGGSTPSPTGPGQDFLIISYAADGTEQWWRTYNGPADNADNLKRLEVDSLGNILAVGSSVGLTTVETAIVKLDRAGTLLWEFRHSSGPLGEYPKVTQVGLDDSLYVSARSGTAQNDWMTFRVSPTGALRWEILHVGSNSNGWPESLCLGPQGTVAVTGRRGFKTIKYLER